MAFQFNGVVPTRIVFNGIDLEELVFNGTTVWTTGPLPPTEIGLFYGGYARLDLVTRIDASGVMVGSETTAGSGRYGLAGASVGGIGLFYGGYIGSNTNRVTRI